MRGRPVPSPAPALVAAAAAALVLLAGPYARADRILLTNGGVLEGTAVRDGASYRIRLAAGAEITLPVEAVAAIEPSQSPREVYQERLAALEATDAQSHYRLGLWCLDQGLRTEALERFRHVVGVVPDHEGARAGIGEVYWQGQWVPVELALQERGLVEHDGRWVTPADRDRLVFEAAVRDARARLRAAVKRLRLDGLDRAARDAAYLAIAGEREPAALEPVLELVDYSHADVRRAAATALAALPVDRRADAALAKLAAEDTDLAVQDAAADAIRAGRRDGACELLLERYTDSPAFWVRNASAHALGRIRWKPAAPALVSTLAMRIYRRQVLPNRIDPYVRRTRNGVEVRGVVHRAYPLGAGEYRVVEDVAFNDAARVALRTLAQVDHDFDTRAWAAWWRAHWARFDDFMEPVTPTPPAAPPAAPAPAPAPPPAPGVDPPPSPAAAEPASPAAPQPATPAADASRR